jgi:transposase
MEGTARIWFTPRQRAELWERWKNGQCVADMPCLVGIEACASSHHWSRELQALGHTVRLMPPA